MTNVKLDIQVKSNELKLSSPLPQQIIDWGVSLVQAPQVWTETRGEGIKILILDTGIDYRHPDISPNFKAGKNFTTPQTTDFLDRHGHGTHCAGIIAGVDNDIGIVGVAPGAEIYAGKILNDQGGGKAEWLINGIKYGIELGVDIISLSMGTARDPGESLHSVVKEAREAGIVIVAASGNDGGEVNYPAAYDEVIAVAAIDQAFDDATFSNLGEAVDYSAPGVDILSTYINGQYAKLSGTSMATPMVTGVIALLQAYSRKKGILADSEQIFNMIKHHSTEENKAEHRFGNGIINVFKLLKQYNETLI